MTYQPMSHIQGGTNIRAVNIPVNAGRAQRGKTKYDNWFDMMLKDDRAIQISEYDLEAIKKAAFRYMKYRGLTPTLSFRQRKDHKTRTFIVWFMEKINDNTTHLAVPRSIPAGTVDA